MTLHLSPASILARNKQKQKEWREAHPEQVRAFHVKHNARPETKERKLKWAQENRDHINTRRREQYQQRRQNVSIDEESAGVQAYIPPHSPIVHEPSHNP